MKFCIQFGMDSLLYIEPLGRGVGEGAEAGIVFYSQTTMDF